MHPENRSWLFVPGDDQRKIAKATTVGADAIIFDLEDAVAAERRPAARSLVAQVLGSSAVAEHAQMVPRCVPGGPETANVLSESRPTGTQYWVRINPLDTPEAITDLAAVIVPGLIGVVLPKIRRASDVATLCHYLTALEARAEMVAGSVGIMVVATETPEMMFRLGDLAGVSPRLRACTWGAEDLSTALGASTNKAPDGAWDDPYRLARSLCLFAARAAQVQPIDTLQADFRDDAALIASTILARRQGFTGRLAIHPAQVAIINEHFGASPDEVAHARAIVAAFAENPGAGAVQLDGTMLDRPHLIQAERLLARPSTP